MTKNLKSKNILYITHSYNNFVKFQVEILSKKFNHVYVLVRHKPVTALTKIINISEVKFHSLEYKVDETNKPNNITVIPTPIWYLPFDWFYSRLGPWHTNAVRKAVKKHNIKFDIVHAHILWSAGFAAMNIAKEFSVPLVVTGHGQDIYKQPFKDSNRRKGIVNVLKSADEVITVSQNNLRIIKSLGIKRKVHVIPNGFDSQKYKLVDRTKLRKELGLPKNKKIFVTVANLEHVKGHDILISAIKEVVRKDKGLLFVFVGGGPLYSQLKRKVKREGLEEFIQMTNFKQHSEVIKYELASDFFVLPSRIEGVPTVMFEAMACGIPFISTRVGGIPEVATKKSGILVEKENIPQLSDAILKALEMKWNSKEIIAQSKQYTWDNICKKIESIYQQVC